MTSDRHGAAASAAWDHSTDERFFEYYAEESASPEALVRFSRIRDHILRFLRSHAGPLDVADIGCGAGTHSRVWAEAGHRVHALDVNGPLVELARKRASEAGHDIDFRVGSATALPWPDESMDVCIALELLEHVGDWESCMREFMRVVRPGGALFLTTTSRLCPRQAEFTLPLYSWYPRAVQRHYEKLAFSTRPELANYARYPAVHWFTWYQLRRVVAARGFRSLDRFDIMDTGEKGALARRVVSLVQAAPVFRFLGQVCTPGTILLAIRDREPEARAAQ
jgi:SAM-dependent methyltransferase